MPISNLTFMIYLDGCIFDYVTNENMPYLSELGQKGWICRESTVCGFTQGIALKTGKYSDETDRFTWFRYSPETSPFVWLKPFRFLGNLPQYRFYPPVKVLIRKLTSFATGRPRPDPAHIPLDFLHYFENVSEEVPDNIESLESVCRRAGLRYFDFMTNFGFIGTRKYSDIFETVYKTIELRNIYDLYMIHIGELDVLGHKFGPRSEFFTDYLKGIDDCVRRLCTLTNQQGLSYNVIVASDHGMQQTRGAVDIVSQLNRLDLKVHRDYIYFLESTLARFWFFNNEARDKVTRMLQKLPHGHILSDAEKQKMHVNFQTNSYGDLFFWLDKGYMIYPNFHQSRGSKLPNGMHGYTDDNDGVIVVFSDSKNIKKDERAIIPLVEVFAIVRSFLKA